MATYILLTRIVPEAVKDPKTLAELEKKVADKVAAECPGVRWLSDYTVLGPYDYVDIFEAPDNETATKVSVIIRSFGHAVTEIWPATPWDRFKDMVQSMG